MTVPLCLLATLLALAPSVLPAELADALGRGSRLALATLPFVALAGLPRVSRSGAGVRAWPLALAFALPAGALAAWLDLRNGWSPRSLAVTAAVAGLLVALLGEASHRARGRPLHALAWLALVPGAPALMAALVWVATAGAERGAVVRGIYHASPVGWAVGRAGASAGPGSAEGLALLGAIALLALALLSAREERA